MLKFIHAATMLLSLVGTGLLAMLGMTYVYEGSGLHPTLASILAALMLSAGWYAASCLARADE
jgi:hypothetical protein